MSSSPAVPRPSAATRPRPPVRGADHPAASGGAGDIPTPDGAGITLMPDGAGDILTRDGAGDIIDGAALSVEDFDPAPGTPLWPGTPVWPDSADPSAPAAPRARAIPPMPDLTPPPPARRPPPGALGPQVAPARGLARLARAARRLRDQATDTLWPPCCVLCRDPVLNAHGLCAACWRDTTFAASPLCDRCGAPTPGAGDAPFCDACARETFAFRRARAATIYDGGGRRMVLSLKHGDRLDLARPAAIWMRRAGWPLLEDGEVIAPVPLHWTRLLKRRFNQSAELTRALHALSVAEGPHPAPAPILDLLIRTRATPTQGGRDRAARAANMTDAFAVRPRHRARIAGRRIVLVDDVMTTGATLSACAQALLDGGAAAVDALCLARVAPHARGLISGGGFRKDPE